MSTQFASNLRLARRKAGYIQADIATLMAEPQSTVSDLERGDLRPTLDQLIKLSLIYGRSFEVYYAERMAVAKRGLKQRITALPAAVRPRATTFNRAKSLQRLRSELAHVTKNDDA